MQVQLPGTVDSTPIYLHGVTVAGKPRDVFFVTTTYGRTIAVDAAAGKVLWTYTPPGYSSWAGSYRITNAAPVADPSRRYVYAAAPDGRIRKLAVANGRQVWSTAVTLLPEREKLASALTFDRGHVIVPTGGYVGDQPPYQGHVTLLDASSGRVISTWNSLCSDRHGIIAPASCPASDSAIWARSGVVVVPGTHRLLFATGNGPYDGHTNWGDSVVELAPDAGVLTRHWTPADFQQLEDSDADLGSTGPAVLPGGWFVQGGKDGKLRLIRLSRLAGNGARTGGETQVVPTPGGSLLFGEPFVWKNLVFLSTGSGTDAWRFTGSRLVKAWGNGTAGTSPLGAGGLLYVYDLNGGLNVYVPATGRLVRRLDSGAGHGQTPVVADGRIALGEGNANDHLQTGVLDLWRLP
ncbi:MAG TPA: PQQ-binding-like beta-propeller repeat protein [Gaiellaceae bacterium]|nr:PQQ-binding-like beta-propeller repeat protein [Gaiellaceae bacterium]